MIRQFILNSSYVNGQFSSRAVRTVRGQNAGQICIKCQPVSGQGGQNASCIKSYLNEKIMLNKHLLETL